MPLDHYIPQVYLRNFYSPSLRGRMHAINKWSGAQYECDSYSQCRLKNGSTNEYFEEPRAIEIFLKDIEPKYNRALSLFRQKNIGGDTNYTISGLIAYIQGCSPTGVRIAKDATKNYIEAIGTLTAAKNTDTQSPNLSEINLSDKSKKVIKANVEPKYAQSFGITQLINRLYLFGNSR